MKKPHALAAVLAAFSVAAAACAAPAGQSDAGSTSKAGATTSAATAAATASGWALVPARGAANIKAAGLQVLANEGSGEHYHAHLDVFLDGSAIHVPAEIGVSFGADGHPNGISALHTHDGTGIVHIEAPVAGLTYTLGQTLTEWGVLDANGSLPGSTIDQWSVYLNGAKQTGDPRDVVLKSHAEISLVHGAAPARIPDSYSFPSGY